jgi:hypothetical protein
MGERIVGVLATFALKIEENDGMRYAGDIAASGKLAGLGLNYLIFCGVKPETNNNTKPLLCQDKIYYYLLY